MTAGGDDRTRRRDECRQSGRSVQVKLTTGVQGNDLEFPSNLHPTAIACRASCLLLDAWQLLCPSCVVQLLIRWRRFETPSDTSRTTRASASEKLRPTRPWEPTTYSSAAQDSGIAYMMHSYLYNKGRSRTRTFWDIWCDMPIFAISPQKVLLLTPKTLRFLDGMSPKLQMM